MAASPEAHRKRSERNAFLLLTVALFPILAITLVAGYGFAVWIWQMLVSGPPRG